MQSNKLLKFSILLPFLFFSITSISQTYWDVESNGVPVKQLTEVTTDADGNELNSSTYYFHPDGKLDRIESRMLLGEGADAFMREFGTEFKYRGDSLFLLVRKSEGEIESVSLIRRNYNNIFEMVSEGYLSELDALTGAEPEGIAKVEYTDGRRTLYSWENTEMGISGYTKWMYKKGFITGLVTSFTPEDGEENTSEFEYKIIKKGKYGVEELKQLPTGHTTKRSYTPFSQEELEQPVELNYVPSYTVDDLVTAFRGDPYSMSSDSEMDDRKAMILEMGIDLIEEHPEAIDTTMYDPIFFYRELIGYRADMDRHGDAIALANRALEHFGDEEENALEMYGMLSYLFEMIENHDLALENYLKLQGKYVGRYDGQGNNYSLRLAKLYFLSGDREKGIEALNEWTVAIDETLEEDDFDPSNLNFDGVSFIERATELLILAEDFAKAEKYASVLADFWDNLYGRDSEEYKAALQMLEQIKGMSK